MCCGNQLGGGNCCCWIIILLLILFCCCGNGNSCGCARPYSCGGSVC